MALSNDAVTRLKEAVTSSIVGAEIVDAVNQGQAAGALLAALPSAQLLPAGAIVATSTSTTTDFATLAAGDKVLRVHDGTATGQLQIVSQITGTSTSTTVDFGALKVGDLILKTIAAGTASWLTCGTLGTLPEAGIIGCVYTVLRVSDGTLAHELALAALIVAANISDVTDFGALRIGDKILWVKVADGHAVWLTCIADGTLPGSANAAIVDDNYLVFRAMVTPGSTSWLTVVTAGTLPEAAVIGNKYVVFRAQAPMTVPAAATQTFRAP